MNLLTLPLLVTRVLTYDTYHTLAPNDLALAADFLYRRLNSHFFLLLHLTVGNRQRLTFLLQSR